MHSVRVSRNGCSVKLDPPVGEPERAHREIAATSAITDSPNPRLRLSRAGVKTIVFAYPEAHTISTTSSWPRERKQKPLSSACSILSLSTNGLRWPICTRSLVLPALPSTTTGVGRTWEALAEVE